MHTCIHAHARTRMHARIHTLLLHPCPHAVWATATASPRRACKHTFCPDAAAAAAAAGKSVEGWRLSEIKRDDYAPNTVVRTWAAGAGLDRARLKRAFALSCCLLCILCIGAEGGSDQCSQRQLLAARDAMHARLRLHLHMYLYLCGPITLTPRGRLRGLPAATCRARSNGRPTASRGRPTA